MKRHIHPSVQRVSLVKHETAQGSEYPALAATADPFAARNKKGFRGREWENCERPRAYCSARSPDNFT